MASTICSKKQTIRIAGEDLPAELVRDRMLAIESQHIEYVLECFAENTTNIRNIKSYLLTAIFNAPTTIGSYYQARVNHDLYGK